MKKRYPFIRAVMIVVYAFIFLPIFIVALMSFNASQYGTFPFVFSTKWYVRLFTGASLGGASLAFHLVFPAGDPHHGGGGRHDQPWGQTLQRQNLPRCSPPC